jgi:hypothetical protein
MNPPLQKARYLSEPQNKRFAGLITVFFGRKPYDFILKDLLHERYVFQSADEIFLTEKGTKELHRLAFFCGLLVTGDDVEPMRLSYVEPE